MNISDYAVPIIIVFVLIFALIKGTDIFSTFVEGINNGLTTIREIFPPLFILVLAIGMFKASGGLEVLTAFLSPVTDFLGFPRGCVPLLLFRPFSGSGAIAISQSILTEYGADSLTGRIASVMLGSSETTFYTIAVYFAATKVKKFRYAVFAALMGDVFVATFAVIFTQIML